VAVVAVTVAQAVFIILVTMYKYRILNGGMNLHFQNTCSFESENSAIGGWNNNGSLNPGYGFGTETASQFTGPTMRQWLGNKRLWKKLHYAAMHTIAVLSF
jgi:hypothetical protein